MVFAPLLVKTS